MLDKMLDHLYSPQMSDIFVKLLNSLESPFKSKSYASDTEIINEGVKSESSGSSAFSENAAQEIR